MSRRLPSLALVAVLTWASPVLAQQPDTSNQKPEVLPAPKALAPSVIVVTPAYPQPGTREVWQYYAVDGRGRFVPRVLYQPPHGAFYLHDGRSYPWTTTRPTLWMPYAID
ncbi:MAG: hypothetical protein L0Y71_18515 [Gemmataceae bacterium]|nr:hypothetical protein [Gemmataceae bacterium]